MDTLFLLGAGLAIGLAALWVGIWEGMVAKKSLEAMGKNPDLSGFFLLLTILWIALVESAAIYGFIVALNIINGGAGIEAWQAIGAWLAVWLAWLGAWLWEWRLVASAMDSVLRNPEQKNKIMGYTILFVALVESVAIYGFITALNILA